MHEVFPSRGGPDRTLECVGAVEAAFMQLLDRAEEAGWRRDEALRAVCVLVWQSIAPIETGNAETL
jgi:hypothetical protein